MTQEISLRTSNFGINSKLLHDAGVEANELDPIESIRPSPQPENVGTVQRNINESRGGVPRALGTCGWWHLPNPLPFAAVEGDP